MTGMSYRHIETQTRHDPRDYLFVKTRNLMNKEVKCFALIVELRKKFIFLKPQSLLALYYNTQTI
jgi:hypothetical protein